MRYRNWKRAYTFNKLEGFWNGPYLLIGFPHPRRPWSRTFSSTLLRYITKWWEFWVYKRIIILQPVEKTEKKIVWQKNIGFFLYRIEDMDRAFLFQILNTLHEEKRKMQTMGLRSFFSKKTPSKDKACILVTRGKNKMQLLIMLKYTSTLSTTKKLTTRFRQFFFTSPTDSRPKEKLTRECLKPSILNERTVHVK